MYPRNAASPIRISIGAVIQISNGEVQTSGCTVRVIPEGGAESDGGGTTAYSTDGVVLYTPTQAETNYTAFVLVAKKTDCFPATVTVVTTASSTAGQVKPADGSIVTATFGICATPETTKTALLPAVAAGAANGLVIGSAANALAVDSSGKVATPDTQKVDVNTVKQRAVTDVGVGNTVYLGTAAWSTVGAQMDLVNAPNATALGAIGAKIEAMVLDEGDATALLAAIAAKVEAFLINEGDATATLAAIAAACNAAVVAGTVGTQVNTIHGKLPAGGAAMHAAGAAVAKSPATLDWAADVSNKPTIGTSTLTQTQVSGGTYDLTNPAFVAAFKEALGAFPISLSADDVTGNLPADVKAWDGSGELPAVGGGVSVTSISQDIVSE